MLILIVISSLLFITLVVLKVRNTYMHEDIISMKNELMSNKRTISRLKLECIDLRQERDEYRFMYKQIVSELNSYSPRRAKQMNDFLEKFKEYKDDIITTD